MDIQKRIDELERKMDLLEKRVQRSESWPFVSPAPMPNACSVCGLEFKGAMGYVCTNSKCPTAITC